MDIQPYLDACICIDAITRNEDRHFNNLSIIKGDKGYRFAPLYDNGLSCLADTSIYPVDIPVKECIDMVYAKPFYVRFEQQLKLIREPIVIDIDCFLERINYLPHEFDRAKEVILMMLQQLEGTAWKRN